MDITIRFMRRKHVSQHSKGARPISLLPLCSRLSIHPSLTRNVYWVDTVGWEDIHGDDVEIFQSMLKTLNRHDLLSVKAVLWNIHPGSIRQTTTLHRQARFINAFAAGHNAKSNDIWDRVIIVGKKRTVDRRMLFFKTAFSGF